MGLTDSLLRIGAIQYGRFEQPAKPGQFAPLSLNLKLLPSYPALLTAMAKLITPLTQVEGVTHLLAMPATVPLATMVSVMGGMPLMVPLNSEIEGAYDFNVPTVLLTDVLTDGAAELALIKQAKGEGLDVHAVVAVIDFERQIEGLPADRLCWQTITRLLDDSQRAGRLSALLRDLVDRWRNP